MLIGPTQASSRLNVYPYPFPEWVYKSRVAADTRRLGTFHSLRGAFPYLWSAQAMPARYGGGIRRRRAMPRQVAAGLAERVFSTEQPISEDQSTFITNSGGSTLNWLIDPDSIPQWLIVEPDSGELWIDESQEIALVGSA